MRDAEVTHAIHPIVLKFPDCGETTKALLECGVSRAANVAQISTRNFLINRYAANGQTKQRDLFQAT